VGAALKRTPIPYGPLPHCTPERDDGFEGVPGLGRGGGMGKCGGGGEGLGCCLAKGHTQGIGSYSLCVQGPPTSNILLDTFGYVWIRTFWIRLDISMDARFNC